MFILKAEIRKDLGPNTYHMFEAPSVRVGKPEMVVPSANDPDLAVSLCDVDGSEFRWLGVGHGIGHYSAVYIMNAQGKTVDTVYPPPQPGNSAIRVAA